MPVGRDLVSARDPHLCRSETTDKSPEAVVSSGPDFRQDGGRIRAIRYRVAQTVWLRVR